MDKNTWYRQQMARLDSCPAQEFQTTVLDLFKSAGYKNIQVMNSHDNMLQFRGEHRHGLHMCHSVIVCRRNKGELQKGQVDDFLSRFDQKLGDRVCGMLVTTGLVSRELAERVARETWGMYQIVSGLMLCDLLHEQGFISRSGEKLN